MDSISTCSTEIKNKKIDMKKRTVIEGTMRSSRETMRREVETNISILNAIKKIVRRIKQKRNAEI